MKIRIHVTKEILEKSSFCSMDPVETEQDFNEKNGIGFNCAIALAVRDLFPMAFIGRGIIWFPKNAQQFLNDVVMDSCSLPLEASEFICDFDNAEPWQRKRMKPISFDIEVPDSVIERIGISQVYKILSESKTLEYVG